MNLAIYTFRGLGLRPPNDQTFDMQPLNLVVGLDSPEKNSAFAGQGSEVCPLS